MLDGSHNYQEEDDSSHQTYYVVVLQELQCNSKNFSAELTEYDSFVALS
jgi:hypothetical protein